MISIAVMAKANDKRGLQASRSTRDREATKAEILGAAVEEFARNGLANARIEAIALILASVK